METRRRSSVMLPFNVTSNRTIQSGNVTYLRNKKTPAKRRKTEIEIPENDFDNEILMICEGV